MFSIDAIFDCTPNEMVPVLSQTESHFFVHYESSFVLINDDETQIIGIDRDEFKRVKQETIQKHHSKCFGEQESNIQNVLFHKSSESLMVSGSAKKVVQLKKNETTYLWEEIKDFGDLGLKHVFSSTQIGHLAFFGGFNGCFRVINVKTGEIVGSPFRTAVKSIYTMETCVASDSKVYLSVGGEKAKETAGLSDFFDITLLCEKFESVTKPKDINETISKELQAFLEEKDQTIEAQKNELISLKQEISDFKKSNQGKQ